MKIFIKLSVLTLFIIGISACGKTGDLQRVKAASATTANSASRI